MSRYFLIIILMTLHVRIFSQLPNGSPAPDFDVQDVYGNTFSLYAMMGANKSACVGFEAVWCSFCWHFKQSGVLQDVANTLSSQTTIVMMESEFQTNTDCLFGLPTCNDYTWGDWVTGMPFQVADLSSTNGPNIATDYNRYTYPLLYVISPDKRTWLIVERTYANYSNWITKSFALNATGTLTHSTCGDNGKIILNVSGGFGAITYKWSNGATTKDLNNIPGGSYSVTITDGNKYFKSFGPFAIDGPSKRVDVTNLELVNVKCFNQSTGSIEVQLDYGTPPYAYNWSNGDKTNRNVNLKVGNYNLTITDNLGCTRVKSYTLTQPSLLTASAVGSIEMCDNSDGSILVKALGGYPPYVFDIGNGDQGSPELKNLKGGKEYTVVVTDNNGCKESIKVNVDVTHKPKVEAGINEPIDCIIDTISLDGSQSDHGSGFINLWTTVAGNIVSGNESLTPDVNKPGMYYLKVTNTNNKCFDLDSVFVIDERVFPDIDATGDTTFNCKLTEITAKGNSNHLPIKYYWKKDGDTIFYSTEKNISVTDSGRYLFHVKDTINLCLSIDTVTIGSDHSKPDAHAKVDKDVSCINSEVIINASSSSQGPNFKYTWSTTNGNIKSGANTLEPVVNKGGDYKLEVENTNNYCINTTSVIVREQTQPYAFFEQSINGLAVQFSDKSNGIPTAWTWTFGDGGSSPLENPTHVYDSIGEYEVCLVIENDCGQDVKCQKIFLNGQADLVVNCPANVTEVNCQTQASINSKFTSWLTTASFTGGCDAAISNNNKGAPSACGGTQVVTFTATSSCDPPVSCSAAFSVSSAPVLVLTCPANKTEAACQSQDTINKKYNDWLASAISTGGCNPTLTNNSVGPPSACGGTSTVSFVATSSCEAPKTCISIFSVQNAPIVNLTCPANQTEATGQTQSQIDAKFDTWLSQSSFTGGCNATLTNNNSGAPPNTGGSTTVTFTVISACEASVTCSAVFTVDEMTATQPIDDIRIFELTPNPVNDYGFIKIQFDQSRSFELNVFNVFGESVWSYSSRAATEDISLDMSLYPVGLYFVVLNTDSVRKALKCIVTPK